MLSKEKRDVGAHIVRPRHMVVVGRAHIVRPYRDCGSIFECCHNPFCKEPVKVPKMLYNCKKILYDE